MRPKKKVDTDEPMTPSEMADARRTFKDDVKQWKADGAIKAKKPRSESEDMWKASGCHPTCAAMQVFWFLSQAQTSQGLVVPNRENAPSVADSNPLWVAKWLWDTTGDPRHRTYDALADGQHPPWVPKSSQGSVYVVNHAAIWLSLTRITSNGKPLVLNNVDMRRARPVADRKVDLKQALLKCGPIAINMTHPGHYILLYGYRGRHMYIIDPGQSIWTDWAKGQNQILEAAPKKGRSFLDHVFSILPPAAPGFAGTNIVIDAEHQFAVESEGGYSGTFLDALIGAQGYFLPGIAEYPEFRDAQAPDERDLNGDLPTQYSPPAIS